MHWDWDDPLLLLPSPSSGNKATFSLVNSLVMTDCPHLFCSISSQCITYDTPTQSLICRSIYLLNISNMSAPAIPSPCRSYSDAMWNTYITEAIPSGNCKKYCTGHSIPYITFNRKYAEYNKENWSPKSKRQYSHPCVQ